MKKIRRQASAHDLLQLERLPLERRRVVLLVLLIQRLLLLLLVLVAREVHRRRPRRLPQLLALLGARLLLLALLGRRRRDLLERARVGLVLGQARQRVLQQRDQVALGEVVHVHQRRTQQILCKISGEATNNKGTP